MGESKTRPYRLLFGDDVVFARNVKGIQF